MCGQMRNNGPVSTDEPLSGNPSSRTGQNDARTTRPMPVAGEAGADGDGSIASLSNGRYQLVERIGAGSIGQVWRAQDTTLQREVAIKTINLATSADPSTEARFRREAIATAGLNHPSIVQIYDSGVDGHSAYIVMEFLHGPNLQSIVTERGPIDWRAAVPLLAQVAAGLGSAHRLGVVHRDVKPANVVLSSEELTSTPKLVDFGIARLADQQATALTSTMTAIGSAAYMSPEQAAGERVGPNSDMYSFGCLMMTVLTGQPPFPGESPVAVARAQVYDTPPLLRSRVPDAPVSLENLVAALMDKSPEARPSATETVAALNAIHGDPDAPGLIEPPRPAGPGTDMATVAMSAAALGAAATQTADGQGLTRILPADASAAEAASGPGATGTTAGAGA
ncbi:kinase domain protein, partial [Propionibacterium acidifaciens F0233]